MNARRITAGLLAVVLALGSTGVVTAIETPIATPGSLGRAILYHLDFATDIDGTPVEEGDTFVEGGPRVLALLGWDFVPAGTDLRLRIYTGNRLVYDDTRTTSREEDGGFIFNFQPSGGIRAGAYIAQLDYNGVPDEVATFAVLPAGTLPALTPSDPAASGPAALVPYADPSKVLVVTRKSVLTAKLGARAGAVFEAAAKVGRLVDLDAGGVKRDTVELAVTEVQRLLRAGTYRYLLILGNDDAVPYAHMANPFADDERDVLDSWDLPSDWVPSDNPYTDLDGDRWVVPDIAIARIPSSDDADLLLRQLGVNLTPAAGAFALVNQKRRSIAEPVLETIDRSASLDRRYAPPTDPEDVALTGAKTSRYTYMLLHGIGVEAEAWATDIVAWSPEDLHDLDGQWIVRPGDQRRAMTVAQAGVTGGIVEIGACYGAWTLDTTQSPTHKTALNDLALAYLKSGTRAYIADTHLSYSAPLGPNGEPVARSGFELLFWQALLGGASPIDAFQTAKVGIAAALDDAVAAGESDAAALDFKTLEIMVYLGRP